MTNILFFAIIIHELGACSAQLTVKKLVEVVRADAKGAADLFVTAIESGLEEGVETGVDFCVHGAFYLCRKYGHPSANLQEMAGGPEQIFTIL